jgi:hypothetical protein
MYNIIIVKITNKTNKERIKMKRSELYNEINNELIKSINAIVSNNYTLAKLALNKVDEMLQQVPQNKTNKKYFEEFDRLWDIVDANEEA